MKKTSKIKVLFLNDRSVIAEGLHHVLSTTEDMEIVGAVFDDKEAIRLIGKLKPDVFIMECFTTQYSNIGTIRLIKDANPSTSVLVVSYHKEVKDIIPLLMAGASGYLSSTVNSDMLLNAIRSIRSGGAIVDLATGNLFNQYIANLQDGPNVDKRTYSRLTAREMDVLKLMVKGMSNIQISNELLISSRTVRTHLTNIYTKMGCYHRHSTIVKALKNGYVKVDDLS